MKSRGFTLIELLIASALTLVILGIVSQGFKGSATATRVIQNQQILLEDMRAASNLIADRAAFAAYIYPPGSSISFNPSGSANTWKAFNATITSGSTSTSNFMAMLLPPRNPGSTPCNAASPDMNTCMQFVVYYPISRTIVTTQATSAENPGADSFNAGDWVIYEYIKVQTFSTLATTSGSSTNPLGNLGNVVTSGGQALMLADYVAPNGFSVIYQSCLNANGSQINLSASCAGNYGNTTAPLQRGSATSLQISLQAQIKGVDKTPPTSLVFYVSPRNVQ